LLGKSPCFELLRGCFVKSRVNAWPVEKSLACGGNVSLKDNGLLLLPEFLHFSAKKVVDKWVRVRVDCAPRRLHKMARKSGRGREFAPFKLLLMLTTCKKLQVARSRARIDLLLLRHGQTRPVEALIGFYFTCGLIDEESRRVVGGDFGLRNLLVFDLLEL